MGNKEGSLSPQKSGRSLTLDSTSTPLSGGPWHCGTCGISNDQEAIKCKVCQTDAPPHVPSPTNGGKRGTFLRSLSGKRKTDASAKPGFRQLQAHDKKKSEPKMAASRRMRTLVINKEENHALVFIKPSVPKSDSVRDHIEEHFLKFKCHLTSEGTLTSEEIAAKGVIDKHYAALARNAMDLNPPKRALSEQTLQEFEQTFGIPYSDEKVLTLGQFLKLAPHVTAAEIDRAWNTGKRVKFAGGLYVGRLEALENDASIAMDHRPLLVVNGFYAAMRADYVTKGKEVLYFTVEWKEKDLSWKDFRALAVGATDPAKAHPDSLRGKMLRHWEEIGLKEAPSIQNNCIHASAGPIEAMKERATWIGMPLEEDPFAQAMLNEGIPIELIKSWSENEVITVDGKSAPAFDHFEDLDSGKVIRTALRVSIGTPRSSDIGVGRKKAANSILSGVDFVEVSSPDNASGTRRFMAASSVISERSEPAMST